MRILFKNGNIYGEDSKLYKFMSVKDGVFEYVGNYKPTGINFNREVDLKGNFVFPGFFDSHIHLLSYSRTLFELNLSGVQSMEEVKKILKNFKPKGKAIYGFGWDDEKWKVKPDKRILDEIFPDRFVILKRRDGHSLWVNSLVLKKFNIDKDTPDPQGGKIERDEEGNPNGVLRDRAMELVKLQDSLYSEKEIINEGIKKLHSLGITSVCNMDGDILPVLIEGKFKLRIFSAIPLEKLDSLISLGLRSFFGDEFLKIGGVKVFLDGSLGSKTCFMKEGFEDEKKNRGLIYFDDGELEEIFKRIEDNNLVLWIHSIGDMANEIILSIFEKLWKKGNLHHRIEHAQILSESLIERIRSIKPYLSIQPSHIYLDVEKIEKYLGKRGRWTYPIKSLMNSGSVVSFGSDAPIEDPEPLKGIKVSIERKAGGKFFYPEEAITVKEAFRAYTINGAISVGEETRLGSIKEGKAADFIIFDADPLSLNAKVIATYINGISVFEIL